MENDTKKLVKSLYYLSTVGLAMALSVSIGAFLGYWLDEKLHTEPWLFFVFLALGIAAAFRNLYVMVKKSQEL